MRTFAPSPGPTQATGLNRNAGPSRLAVVQAARPSRSEHTEKREPDPNPEAQTPARHRFSQFAVLPKSHSAGGRMPADVRTKMERHFGYDFSAVRIHQDSSAAGMGARAYAQGEDLHFAPGAYAPRTLSGQQLLGHELAHVVQQAQGRVRVPAQAKGDAGINDDPALEREADRMGADAARGAQRGDRPKEDLEARLRRIEAGGGGREPVQRKVKVPAKTKLPDFDDQLTRSGDTYFYPTPIRKKGELSLEIFTSLFNSPRTFTLKGSTGEEAQKNLMRHLRARKGVISFAEKKKYVFAGGTSNFRMNPKYWWLDRNKGTFGYKEGVDRQEAREDLNKNPGKYAIGCAAATKITVKGGANAPRREGTTSDDHDWVPGEDGYIENTGWNGRDAGLEGENIIYMGGKMYWGHFSNALSVQPYTKWFELVKSWDGGAKLTKDRNYPSTGMK